MLAHAGIDMHVTQLDRGNELPAPESIGGAIVMGGAMGVHDTDDHPWLATERRWITRTVEAGIPVLGVCLGAQQLAAALGAVVTTGPSPETGVDEVELTPEGRLDPVLGPEGDRLQVIQWHGDSFEIPDGAVHLAFGARYRNQAFRYGRVVYGLQFQTRSTTPWPSRGRRSSHPTSPSAPKPARPSRSWGGACSVDSWIWR